MPISALHDPQWRSFASDNYAGVHPAALAAIAAANGGHQVAYGEDAYTERLREVIRAHFGEAAETYPVFNGTGANVVGLTSLLPRWGAVITATSAHINTDEAGAPERMTGLKLLTVPSPDGKLTPDLVAREAYGWGNEHRAQPLAVSISQTTELGTLYSPDEIRIIAAFAHEHDMAVHLDGSRLWNAAAALDLPLRAFTTDAGVDVLSLGGTKNGLLGAEAVVVLDPARATGLTYLRKLTMQLASKMRFASAQLLSLFEDDLGLRNARHANAMTTRLRNALEAGIADGSLPSLEFTQPTQANAIFATLPTGVADRIRDRVRFYDWDRARGEVRWMTAWDTTPADVDAFVAVIGEELSRA
ncbi:threonine aldolase family protein [Mycolicibacterium diernhoferi]|uniref:Threonine aldolase n=1 Tax=Mycolicibacterium diernhoferi TaxID=1801 RepID=A0A1Q4HB98_9MYCO|nr:low specificity L-threonine aldolase [Mycolicibacterium diernhoferi]OJZ64800.1 threonine aldolase [Mycolicibacterium diernhoferi]OPE54125.1 threonine aldolase [Mycolicibacterium diernhoferi]PEG51602.1 low specificity L-threonine aldolase [Mycolicibacterium diernhoferi]QYL22543.1 low specificity L-threonine aldolase [Mycolicibacterium diernhoferi]